MIFNEESELTEKRLSHLVESIPIKLIVTIPTFYSKYSSILKSEVSSK